tara:strand:+ start:398 stop:577 length:180 start_codon:yes stop_codon:yes gene_type:complete
MLKKSSNKKITTIRKQQITIEKLYKVILKSKTPRLVDIKIERIEPKNIEIPPVKGVGLL